MDGVLTGRCWDVSIEYVLNDHDPRRMKPLVDFCINQALSADFMSGSAFDCKLVGAFIGLSADE